MDISTTHPNNKRNIWRKVLLKKTLKDGLIFFLVRVHHYFSPFIVEKEKKIKEKENMNL
eukprot:UN10851